MRRLFVLAALIALVTTACKLETNFGAIINADGSGTIIAEFGVDDEAAELFLEGQDPFQDNEFADMPGARTREERRGDLTYYIVEVDVEDVNQIENELLGSSDSLFEGLTIDVAPDLVTVSGSASAEDSMGGEAEGFDPSVIEDSFSASVYFTMPGEILSHNADRQQGNTLYWDVPVLGGSLDIQATSDPTGTPASGGDGGFPVWAYAVLAVVVLGALWYFMQNRTPPTPAGTAEAFPTPASDETPPAPPPAE